jgi:hypothetical protein
MRQKYNTFLKHSGIQKTVIMAAVQDNSLKQIMCHTSVKIL